MAEAGPEDGPLTLDGTARAVGGHAWVAAALFEDLGAQGAAAAAAGDQRRAVALAVWSRRFGELAVAWRGLVPRTHDHDPDAFVTPPPGWSTDGTVEARLAAYEDLLLAHLRRCTPVADAPLLPLLSRALGAVTDARGTLAAA